MSQASATAHVNASAFMPSAMPSQTMQLSMPSSSCMLPPSTTTHFVPIDAAHPSSTPTFVAPPHLASQQSAYSSCTVIVTHDHHQQQHMLFPAQHARFPMSYLSQPTAQGAAAGSAVSQQAPSASMAPAKQATRSRKGAANSADAPMVLGAEAAEGVTNGPVKRKRGPYKKRMKQEGEAKASTDHKKMQEGEAKAPTSRKKKIISLLPAVQAFRLHSMQTQPMVSHQLAACLPAPDHQGPSKRAR